MFITVKYFYENTDDDYKIYDKLWDENRDRFVFLHKNVNKKYQLKYLIMDLNENINRDILAVRFPNKKDCQTNEIINNFLFKNIGINVNNVNWLPKEIWIYEPRHQ